MGQPAVKKDRGDEAPPLSAHDDRRTVDPAAVEKLSAAELKKRSAAENLDEIDEQIERDQRRGNGEGAEESSQG